MPWSETDYQRLADIAETLNGDISPFAGPGFIERIANALERIADTLEQKPAAKPKAAEPVQAVPLTGQELLDKVKDLGDVSKSALVRACGYVTIKKDGGDRLNFTSFYEALLEAKGVDLEELKQEAS
jgi:hypothetical protein